MTMKPTEYQRRKEQAREQAKQWQNEFADASHSWGEIAQATARFERLARRYGLTHEFRENGII